MAHFAAYIQLFENYICPFPKKLATHNSMQKKKTIRWATKPLIKKEEKVKKRAREKDRNRFKKKKYKWKIWLSRMREKQDSCLITSG